MSNRGYASILEKSNPIHHSRAGSRSMLDRSSLLARRSRIRKALGPFHCRKSNIRSGKGQKELVSCTKSNVAAQAMRGTGRTTWRRSAAAGGDVAYWTDYMAEERRGRWRCSVLDGLLGRCTPPHVTQAPGAAPSEQNSRCKPLQRAEFPSVSVFKPNGNEGSPI